MPFNSSDEEKSLPEHQNGEDQQDSDAYTTLIISAKKRRQLRERASSGASVPKGRRELVLVIRGMVERVPLSEDNTIVLGRLDPKASPYADRPDIDLTPYGALERGVSRIHARLELEDEKLFLTDLHSTNGTFLADKRLEPDVATRLMTGSEFLLGRLSLQVLFR